MRLVLGVIFLIIFAVALIAISFGLRFLERKRRQQVEDVLTAVSGEPRVVVETTILRPEEGDLNPAEAFLNNAGFSASLRTTIQQAGLTWTPANLLMSALIAALAGAVLGVVVSPLSVMWLNVPLLAGIAAAIPFLYLRWKRQRRLREVEEQLPEALDFLARSMRAGHAFSISLSMVAQELSGPLGQEFRTLFNETNLGAPLESAISNFADRIPLLDVRLFVSSVLLQRQTGGNLSEVLNRLAHIIRERFRLRGQIRSASAHGRITALALSIMPIAMFVLLPIFAPGYLQSMIADPDGILLLIGAGTAQILGYVIMRSITNIKA